MRLFATSVMNANKSISPGTRGCVSSVLTEWGERQGQFLRFSWAKCHGIPLDHKPFMSELPTWASGSNNKATSYE